MSGPPVCVLVALLTTAMVGPGVHGGAGSPWESKPAPSSFVDFNLTYSDPASDVMLLWSANGTPVVRDGALVLQEEPKEVNIKWVRSKELDPARVEVSIQVVGGGGIADRANTSYVINMYSDTTNKSHYYIEYSNARATLKNNLTGESADLTANATLDASGNPNKKDILRVAAAKSMLKNLTAWNIDATAKMVSSPYTYQDFGWEVPGNPGSTPQPPPPPSGPFGLPANWLVIALLVIVAITVVAAVIALTRKRKGVRPASR